MKNIHILLLLLFASCASSRNTPSAVYYEISPEHGYFIYKNSDCSGAAIAFIPSLTPVYTKFPGKKTRVYVTCGSISGFARKLKYTAYSNSGYTTIPQHIIDRQDAALAKSRGESYQMQHISLPSPSGGGAVQVKGYYRKDGTYVKPHTRSAPKKH